MVAWGMSIVQRVSDLWRLPELVRLAGTPYHPGRKAALEALSAIDDPRVAEPILGALDGSDRDVYAIAAAAAGRRRLQAARPALERLCEFYAPPLNPDYVPESWAQDRVEREMADDAATEVRAAASEALRLLDAAGSSGP